jgi:hypothetical protein
MQNYWVVISNVFFFIPSFLAFSLCEYFYFVIYFIIPFTSGSFHACSEGFGCLFPFDVHVKLDYITATLIAPMTMIYIVRWEQIWKPMQDILILLFLLIISLMVVLSTSDNAYAWQALVIGASILIPITYWIGYAIYMKCIIFPKATRFFPEYQWYYLSVGMTLTVVALILYLSQGTFWYPYTADIHGFWHILAAYGQTFILLCKCKKSFISPLIYKMYSQDVPYINNDVIGEIRKNFDQIDKTRPLSLKIE